MDKIIYLSRHAQVGCLSAPRPRGPVRPNRCQLLPLTRPGSLLLRLSTTLPRIGPVRSTLFETILCPPRQRAHYVISPVRDAPLTQLGRRQSAALNEDTKNTFQLTAELLVSSPVSAPRAPCPNRGGDDSRARFHSFVARCRPSSAATLA